MAAARCPRGERRHGVPRPRPAADPARCRRRPGRGAARGATIGVFAEGTTRCGRDLGPFRPAAFQAAHDAGAPVVPVAVRYRRRGEGPVDAAAAFVGDDTLASSLLRVLATRDLVVDVDVRPAIDARAVPTGPARADARRTLARASAAAIAATLPADLRGHPAAARRGAETERLPELDHAA
ncbi:1-acyl-sn-glycerol-3-phosphate acyltransferase [Actinomycetospora sp. CA-053990]|uniref:1-acyl-sn-glycerol-3-phosphate acyltransferase n=1 Tax=Actinomycetospora sp. CA-053990 TaxID=3239891 RepID=UPI003D933333